MFLLGLRNYGEIYKHTVHNLGEEFILYTDNILNKLFTTSIESQKHKEDDLYIKTTYRFTNGNTITTLLLKSFMNISSQTLMQCTDVIEEIRSQPLIIVYDDLLIPTGEFKASKVKLKTRHNGVISMIESKIKDNLLTIRIGATKPTNIVTKTFVLSKINIEAYRNPMYKFIVYMLDYITNLSDKLDADNLIKHLQEYKISATEV